MSRTPGERSNGWGDPVWWLLFGAGGLCTALVLPALVVVVALGHASGGLPEEAFAYGRVRSLVHQPLGLVFVLTAIVLPVCQALYRLRHGLHDLQLGRDALVKRLCQGGALLIAGLALALWIGGF